MNTINDTLATWADSERLCDATTAATILTEDFIGIGPVGFQLPKGPWLQRLSDGQLHYEELSLDELAIREYSDSAVAVARVNTLGTARGNPLPTPRTAFHLVRADGEWLIAGIQHSFIAGAPGSPVPAPQPEGDR